MERRLWLLHDLCLLAVGVGKNQLHLLDVAANRFAFCLNAAAVQLHSHACKKKAVEHGHKVHAENI